VQEEEQFGDNNINEFQLMEDVNMVPPQEAHLVIGKVETHFFAIPEEHDLTKRFSKQGMHIWENFFAPHLHNSSGNSHTCEIPVSWFNFVTLMLMTPDKFDWARDFLSSQLWIIIKEPIESEQTISFVIPDKCCVTQAPICKILDESQKLAEDITEDDVHALLSPKRKRRVGKVPLVDSEVRRSPRLTLLNDGFKNHDNYVDKNW
jgi:hypothetical protein